VVAAMRSDSANAGASRPVLAYGAQKRRARTRSRETANARARTVVDPATVPDPLRRHPEDRPFATAALAVAGSFALHVAVTLVASLARGVEAPPPKSYEQAVQVQISEPPKPAPVVDAPTPTPPPAPQAPPVPKRVKAVSEEPPPDPVDLPTPPPPPEPPKEPPRRIVGISMESPSVGGGPSFAVGNTRMGQTQQVAQDPTRVERLAPERTPPKRTSAPRPEYPPALKAQGIEGDVGLEVEIDARGHVVRVTTSSPSAHDEFNRAAKDAAERSTYEPAKVNGVAVAESIQFTVTFRLRQ